jgi:hypothetical protein
VLHHHVSHHQLQRRIPFHYSHERKMKRSAGVGDNLPFLTVWNTVGEKQINTGFRISVRIDLKHDDAGFLVFAIYSNRNRNVLGRIVWIGRLSRLSAQDVNRRDATLWHALRMPSLLRSQQVLSRALSG